MKSEKSAEGAGQSSPELDANYVTFGKRLRQIRKEHNLSQEELAKLLGTHKQVISRYERDERSPKLSHVVKFAEKLKVSTDYLLGEDYENSPVNRFWKSMEGKPFYVIFCEIVYGDMGLTLCEVLHLTGLSLAQVRAIVNNRMQVAPLPLAMQLSKALNVPLEVWAGYKGYEPAELSVRAYEVAHAYMDAGEREQAIIRMLLGLELVEKSV